MCGHDVLTQGLRPSRCTDQCGNNTPPAEMLQKRHASSIGESKNHPSLSNSTLSQELVLARFCERARDYRGFADAHFPLFRKTERAN